VSVESCTSPASRHIAELAQQIAAPRTANTRARRSFALKADNRSSPTIFPVKDIRLIALTFAQQRIFISTTFLHDHMQQVRQT
jgi:hypothetical protein